MLTALALAWAAAVTAPTVTAPTVSAPTAPKPAAPTPAVPHLQVDLARQLGHGQVLLATPTGGQRGLWLRDRAGKVQPVECDSLVTAWGLWVADVDQDGAQDLVVALRKPALHDPRVENRLHVYALHGDQCVPLWRGTRLVGRFERLAAVGPQLWALERAGAGQWRVARYRWDRFGYRLTATLWQGTVRSGTAERSTVPPARFAWLAGPPRAKGEQ
ncbi:MAG: hypothetical protein HY902_16115 [Deltaproteobacteria bacterium]|nr:hypothetical protein [Deltaproteobacteria bacterium]